MLHAVIKRILASRYNKFAQSHYQVPLATQQAVYRQLLVRGHKSIYGHDHGLKADTSLADFKRQVPIVSYEELFPYIQRGLRGEANVLWPGFTHWYSKSSGTTNARSKYIPITTESLQGCHFKAGRDVLALYQHQVPESKLLLRPNIALGGSLQPNPEGGPAKCGDISAVMMHNLPWWAQYLRRPKLDVALMSEFEQKLELIAKAAIKLDLAAISGVPTWNVVLLRRVLELTGKSHLREVWPNLELFFHGAVSFGPYRRIFDELIQGPGMHYFELYNASEGFFGAQDDMSLNDEMLLMLDHGIYYEFMPIDELDSQQPITVGLEDVELGRNYALVISTNGGLWRYLIGDTIRFTSKAPYRFKITGRTRSFINVFGEELMVENAEAALTKACQQTGAVASNFTAAPVFMQASDAQQKGGHEWIIEFERPPHDAEAFAQILDDALRQVNSDYDAKRYRDMALTRLKLHIAPQGTFYHWLKYKGKLGGQHKVPRLSNDRLLLEEIYNLIAG